MKKQSAGLLLWRRNAHDGVEVLLVHPGGPFWAKKDLGAWSIPKGEFADGEEPLEAAKREYAEEIGQAPPEGELIELGQAKQSSGKVIYAWALQGTADITSLKSNMFEMEWPPRSGQKQQFPEVDRAEWFSLDEAQAKLVKGQVMFVGRLATHLKVHVSESPASASPKLTKVSEPRPPHVPEQTSLL